MNFSPFKILILLFFLSFYVITVQAQSQMISGFVHDKNTGEAIVESIVYSSDLLRHTHTDNYGFFSMYVTNFDTIYISFVGYKNATLSGVANDTIVNISLEAENRIGTVDVVKLRNKLNSNGAITLTGRSIASLPQFMGEKDIIRNFQTLPGIQAGHEGNSGLNVRGGSPDQNLFLVDGVPVYNVNHLFGFFSVFNADAINSATLYKGYLPAEYGGRLSSVVDITLKEGNNTEIKGKISLGLISSKLFLEGPIIRERMSFCISLRRTYIDVLSRPFIKKFADGAIVGYYFYDVNAKVNFKINDHSRIYFSVYTGKDKYYSKYESEYFDDEGKKYFEKEDEKLSWGNITSVLRWNQLLGNKLYSNVSVSASKYKMMESRLSVKTIGIEPSETRNEYFGSYQSGISNLLSQISVEYKPSNDLSLRAGVSGMQSNFTPGAEGYFIGDIYNKYGIDSINSIQSIYGFESSAYTSLNWNIFSFLKLDFGYRFSMFNMEGKTYWGNEPRLNITSSINRNNKISGSYLRTFQYLHMISNSSLGLPTDIWLPSTQRIAPSNARQYSIMYQNSGLKGFQLTVEMYYKKMEALADYKDGFSYLLDGKQWFEKIEQGKGLAKGIEVLIEKESGSLHGWLSYTLSKSDRVFPSINKGIPFPYKFDRRHYINLVLVKTLNDKIDFGFNWIFSSGAKATLVVSEYTTAKHDYDEISFNGLSGFNMAAGVSNKNAIDLPFYHRLDVNINFHKKKGKIARTLSLGAHNAYWKKNPFIIEPSQDGYIGMSLLPFLPYVNYQINF